jgi:3-methyl-2-oxobutanoate hydroxymethyltransferase
MSKAKTIIDIQRLYAEGRKITMLTAYDYPIARLLDRAGIDIVLIGDSLGTVMAGHDTTLAVTLEEMIYHTRAVARGTQSPVIVADMPFLSYQVDLSEARRSAGRLVKEGGAHAVKLEGGVHVQETIRAIVDMDIPVMGHVGLTPQSVHRMGGYRVQGREEEQAEKILADARAVEEGGAFSIVLEGVPKGLARQITEELNIPTIGIGAGVHCDGQVLVTHDMIGLYDKFTPKFVKQYANLTEVLEKAFEEYIKEVRNENFPDDEHSFK